MDEPIVFDSGPLVLNIMDETQQAVNDYSAVQSVKAVSKKTPQQLNRRGS